MISLPRSGRAPVLLTACVALALALTFALPAASAAAAPSARLVQHTKLTFQAPVWVGGAGDGSSPLYVAEQRGVVWKVTGTRRARWLDLRNLVKSGGEQGLLSLAFSEDYRRGAGRVFAYYTRANGNGQVRQFRVRGGKVVRSSGRVILNVRLSPPTATNHNGGQLWHTKGNLLYLSVGDGGGGGDPAGNAQHLGRLTGKLLRVKPRARGGYTIPADNPFRTRAGARKEIFALGLRNPWRFTIDAPTGDIWIGDVGQSEREEINVLRRGAPAGRNFGWPRMEGNTTYSASTRLTPRTSYQRPAFDYTRAGGACSVTGGIVYRGPVRKLRGWYIYADWCTPKLRLASSTRPAARRATRAGVTGIASFGSGARGHVYAANQRNGHIYRVAG